MAISAKLVKELREKTGAGMMDCKKRLSKLMETSTKQSITSVKTVLQKQLKKLTVSLQKVLFTSLLKETKR